MPTRARVQGWEEIRKQPPPKKTFPKQAERQAATLRDRRKQFSALLTLLQGRAADLKAREAALLKLACEQEADTPPSPQEILAQKILNIRDRNGRLMFAFDESGRIIGIHKLTGHDPRKKPVPPVFLPDSYPCALDSTKFEWKLANMMLGAFAQGSSLMPWAEIEGGYRKIAEREIRTTLERVRKVLSQRIEHGRRRLIPEDKVTGIADCAIKAMLNLYKQHGSPLHIRKDLANSSRNRTRRRPTGVLWLIDFLGDYFPTACRNSKYHYLAFIANAVLQKPEGHWSVFDKMDKAHRKARALIDSGHLIIQNFDFTS
jgi:hypothetical protein